MKMLLWALLIIVWVIICIIPVIIVCVQDNKRCKNKPQNKFIKNMEDKKK